MNAFILLIGIVVCSAVFPLMYCSLLILYFVFTFLIF